MPHYSPQELATQLKSGLLSFPVTHFTQDLEFDEAAYRDHLAWLSSYPVAGLFAAGGTGEGFSLTPEEIDRVVRAAVSEVNGKVPVMAPATGGTASAVAQARAARPPAPTASSSCPRTSRRPARRAWSSTSPRSAAPAASA